MEEAQKLRILRKLQKSGHNGSRVLSWLAFLRCSPTPHLEKHAVQLLSTDRTASDCSMAERADVRGLQVLWDPTERTKTGAASENPSAKGLRSLEAFKGEGPRVKNSRSATASMQSLGEMQSLG